MQADLPSLINDASDNATMSPALHDTIVKAARELGLDPVLLVTIAWRESRFDAAAGNRHSSSLGLLQFTSEAWLQAVHDFGARHGISSFASQTSRLPSGRITVSNRASRDAILSLREDPVLSVYLVAEVMARQNALQQAACGLWPTSTDLYLLHVLGPSGSSRFIAAFKLHPSTSVLSVASPHILRNAGLLARDGRAMTIAKTYNAISTMIDARRRSGEPGEQLRTHRPTSLLALAATSYEASGNQTALYGGHNGSSSGE